MHLRGLFFCRHQYTADGRLFFRYPSFLSQKIPLTSHRIPVDSLDKLHGPQNVLPSAIITSVSSFVAMERAYPYKIEEKIAFRLGTTVDFICSSS